MVRILHAKEKEQFTANKWEPRESVSDKAYRMFLRSIMDRDSQKLYGIDGGEESIPEMVAKIYRVFVPSENKEYLVYDVYRWGYFYDGKTKSPYIFVSGLGKYNQYEWATVPVRETQTDPVPHMKFKKQPRGVPKTVYEIEFNVKNLRKLKEKIGERRCEFYCYNAEISGRGGQDSMILVHNYEDFETRSFKELLEGTYLMQQEMERRLEAVKQREHAVSLREQTTDSYGSESKK